jgi:hypothetical protein
LILAPTWAGAAATRARALEVAKEALENWDFKTKRKRKLKS